MPRKELSPIDVYNLLPRTNCKECGEENCMAFAAKLVTHEAKLEQCKPLLTDPKYKGNYQKLWDLLKPPVKEVVIGVGDRAVKVGGEYVMYRHELTYYNPTAIAIDVSDDMSSEEVAKRVEYVENFVYTYIGMDLKLNAIAVRGVSGDPKQFADTVRRVAGRTSLPLILCTLDPKCMEEALKIAGDRRPLIYAATKRNWREMAELALKYKCPLAVFSPNDLKTLKSLSKTLLEYGVEDLLLDPGTFPGEGLADTWNNFVMLRRLACKEEDELLGFPLIGVPLTAWLVNPAEPETIKQWREAYVAGMLISLFADLLIMHSIEGWVLLPNVILRQNIYTDPRKPVAVEPGLRTFGSPDEMSPVLLTSNFALTYYTVAADIEASKKDCYLLVADTEGLAVECAVAGRKLTAEGIADVIKSSGVEQKVKHRKLIIPGRAARLKGEIEDATGWGVMVGPLDSSGIPKYLADNWPPKET